MVSVDALIPHPKNMHNHPPEQIERLCKLIEYQGFRTPLTVQRGTNLIVTGHGRLMAAKKLGMEKVPVTYQEFDDEAQLYAHIVADNAIGKDTWATLDLSQINLDIQDLGPELDIDMLGLKDFTIEPLDRLEPQSDEDAVPEVEHPISRRGDVWLLGEHRVMCGDSTMIDDVEKLMAGEKFQLVVTDPPYNVDYEGKSKDALKIQNDSMDNDSFYSFLYDAFLNYFNNMDKGAGIYVFHADLEGVNFRTSFTDSGLKLSQVLVWNKASMVMSRSDYHWKHEPILYGWKEGASHNWFTDRKQVSVWDFKRPSRNGEHPTMKPIDILEYPIENSSKRGWVVGDLFLGSGSTLIACEKTNRKCYGMELDEHYCDVIVKRWEDYTGKKATLESTGQTYEELKNQREPEGIK